MVRIGTVAAAIGVVAGAWVFAAVYLGYLGHQACSGSGCSPTTLVGTVTEALGIVLALDSFVCLVGPRRIFYASAFLSAILGGAVLLGPADTTALIVTLALTFGEFVLSLLAARQGTGMSEQQNPMNLPVFG